MKKKGCFSEVFILKKDYERRKKTRLSTRKRKNRLLKITSVQFCTVVKK